MPHILVAVTVVAPLMVRNNLVRISEPRRRLVKIVADVAWNTGLNIIAVAMLLYVQDAYYPPTATTTLFFPPPMMTFAPGVTPPPMLAVPRQRDAAATAAD